MLVAPQSIEASLIARRLERWCCQTCVVSDAEVARALLPERTWQAVLLDHALGTEAVEALAEAAKPFAPHRIVLFTPAARHELATLPHLVGVERLSGQAAARRFACGPPDDGARRLRAGSGR